MDVLEAVASRYSCRAFLPTPVPEATIRDIVAKEGGEWKIAAKAIMGWSGEVLARFER